MFGYNDPSTITSELLCTSFVHLKVHLQKRTKKNAESIDFSAFFEFCLSENESYIHTLITPILTYLRSSLQSSLRKPLNLKAIQKMTLLRSGVKLVL